MNNSNKIWFLPKSLDRRYTLTEKFSVWLGKKTYVDAGGKLRLKPYAVYRMFNIQKISVSCPYMIDGRYARYEQRRYERNGLSLTPYSKYLYTKQFAKTINPLILSKLKRKD